MLHICPNLLHSQVCWWRGGRVAYSMSICHRGIYGLLQAAANLQTQTTKWVHKYRWHATGSWQEYTIPSGYKFASTTFPHLQPSDVRGDGLRKPVKLFLFFFFPHRYIMWVTGWGHVSQLLPQWNDTFCPGSLGIVLPGFCISCLMWFIAWETSSSAHWGGARSPCKNVSQHNLAGPQITL